MRPTRPACEAPARERFEALWDAHYHDIYAFALRRLADPDAARDAAAETFLVTWRRLDSPITATRPWLFGVANKIVANALRTQRRKLALQARLIHSYREPTAALGDPADEVVAAFNRLRPGDRELLSLVVWEELTPSEAAQALGIPTAKFSVRLHRAKKRLRKELAGAGHVEDEAGAAEHVSPHSVMETK